MKVLVISGSQHKKQTSDEAINAVVSSLSHYDLLLFAYPTDESPTQDEVTVQLLNLSEQLNYALVSKEVLPQNFYGVGGMKIFRDLIKKL
ncbi:MAG: hypothetical protein IBX70_13500 [Clostridia bacterium]|nr:hypothetical protein [Clostridia bacterium]